MHNNPKIISRASIVGRKESQGPLAEYFDEVMPDNLWGRIVGRRQSAECSKEVCEKAIINANKQVTDINYMFAGDLLNQIMTANFAARQWYTLFGLFGACLYYDRGIVLGSIMVDGGYANNVLCATSSHFCTAERQFRYPLEQGTQRAPTGQWTVTGAGAVIVSIKEMGLLCHSYHYWKSN